MTTKTGDSMSKANLPDAAIQGKGDWDLEEEKRIFRKIQEGLPHQFSSAFPDRLAPKTVLIIPSFTLDQEILSKVEGIVHYEERLLCLLMLLRMPRTKVIYVTSMPIDPVIIDYYLHLLPGITGYHAMKRLTLLSCYDASSQSLTEKILGRPRLIRRIKDCISPEDATHMACFNVTAHERRLAVQLGMPIFGCDPDLFDLGSKSNGRKIFRKCGLLLPDGFEDLHTPIEIIHSLYQLKKKHPELRKAVVKMNDGFSGEGNAIFNFQGIDQTDLESSIRNEFEKRMSMVAASLKLEVFLGKFAEMGGVVEIFLEGEIKESPSVQCRITPTGICEVVSTHDQLLGGESGQVFVGAKFPASLEYSIDIGRMGKMVSEVLKEKGVLGRFAIDFLSVQENGVWKNYAIEINLRKGGTTHPFLMLQFLTDGEYQPEQGCYLNASGQKRYYFASDNLRNPDYVGLTPPDLIDIAMIHELHYDGTAQEGTMFHLIGALSQFGKLGVVCIGSTPERAQYFYDETVKVLDRETAKA